MATYKMLSTRSGVRKGDVHPVVFREGKTYEIDDDLAAQFKTLDAIEPSGEEPVRALAGEGRDDLHENWLDTDPAVLRHGELTAKEVIARDESADPQTTAPAEQEAGKAEGEAEPEADGSDDKAGRKKSGK